MNGIITGHIVAFDDDTVTIAPHSPVAPELLRLGSNELELRITDGRRISPQQRRKIFATLRDIADWSGHEPEWLRSFMTFDFCLSHSVEPFSLSCVDMTTAREFISYLIDFCIDWDVPTRAPLSERCDDTERFLYRCLLRGKCAVCGQKAEVHHVDRIGMGRDREQVVHTGLLAVSLCREHHIAAHAGEREFFETHHIFGIPLDAALCKAHALRQTKKEDTR